MRSPATAYLPWRQGRLLDRATPIVFHLHGCGYVMGSAALSAPFASRLAAAIGGWSLVPDYRLAPEWPFPAALDDALAAFRWLTHEYPAHPLSSAASALWEASRSASRSRYAKPGSGFRQPSTSCRHSAI